MIAFAAISVAAGSASAQALKVEIPFSFRAGKTMMALGTYQFVGTALHTPSIRLRHYGQGGGIVMLATAGVADRQWVTAGLPKVQFNCLDGRCTLAKVYDGTSREWISSQAYEKLAAKFPLGLADVAEMPEELSGAVKAVAATTVAG